ncbi:MAG: efflux transporter outer membrane subunit [Steroidobacteraceae bacterium]
MSDIRTFALRASARRRIGEEARIGPRSPIMAATLAILTLLGGCAVGPRYVRPAAPTVLAYTPVGSAPNLASIHGGASQHLAIGERIPAQWWQLFHSTELDGVVRQALARNPTLHAAQDTLAAADEVVLEARGGYDPQVDLGASAQRQKGPAFALGLLPSKQGLPEFNLYSLGPTVSYSLDVFGITHRQVEERQAQADTQDDQLAAAYLTITGTVVTQALTLASLHLQIAAVHDIINDDAHDVSLVKLKVAGGLAPRSDVLTAETQLATDRTLLPPLDQQRAIAEDALAVLLGSPPGAWTPPTFSLSDFTLPSELPLSLPSALVRQRPDILAAQAQVHARSAAIGVATAQMYPNIVLSGSIATAALSAGSLFGSSSAVWSAAAGLTAPIFHGGALAAHRREAIANYRAALATYRQTVLSAFGQVADTLRALGHDAALADAEDQALGVAQASLHMQRASYAAGRSDLLQLLDAERSVAQARLAEARATAQRYIDSAQLLVALGGGWWQNHEICARCGSAVPLPHHSASLLPVTDRRTGSTRAGSPNGDPE